MKFGSYLKPTPKKIKKISAFVEALFAAIGGSALVASYPTVSACFLIAAGVCNKFFELFYEEDTTPAIANDSDNAA